MTTWHLRASCLLIAFLAVPAFGQVPVRFTVSAKKEWQNSGVKVSAGDRLVFSAEGRWTSGKFTGGPEGMQTKDTHGYVAGGERAYSLVGKVGSQKFYVGTRQEITVTRSGNLLLSMNDVSGLFGDNSGRVVVTINLTAH